MFELNVIYLLEFVQDVNVLECPHVLERFSMRSNVNFGNSELRGTWPWRPWRVLNLYSTLCEKY